MAQMQPVVPHRAGDRIFRVSRVTPWQIPVPRLREPKTGGWSPLVLVYGFAGLIALGTALLVLPISSRVGQFTPPVNALFTATSATCVTGLAVVDTGTYWSGFGQGVILVLIQVGGFGFMTITTLFLMALGRRFRLREILLVGESLGLEEFGGLFGLVKRIALFTLVVEGTGAVVLCVRFWSGNPAGTAVWRGLFQAVSAFNNAGLDLFGNFRSLQDYQTDVVLLLVTAALIFLGGIGYAVVKNVFTARRSSRLSLNSKLVLSTTALLLALGTVAILLTEMANPATLGPLTLPYKLLDAFFQSVTPRTAGFSVIDLARMADYTLFFTIFLMFIGGASGSTAGGVKVNTMAMLFATLGSTLRGREHAGAFGREFITQQIYRALVVVMLSLGLVTVVTWVLTMTENAGFINLLFETVSAFGTVGLSTGITPGLTVAGRLIISATMFAGRVGPTVLAVVLVERRQPAAYRYPQESVSIG